MLKNVLIFFLKICKVVQVTVLLKVFGSELCQIGIFAQVSHVAPLYCESSLISFQHIFINF